MPSLIDEQEDAVLKVIRIQRKDFGEYHKQGNMIAQRIYEAISSEAKISIDRPLIAGSVGKGTWLGVSEKPDFDVVFLVNNKTPAEAIASSEATISTIAEAVRKLPPPFKFIKKGSCSVTCCHGNFEFDVVPGLNFVRNTALDPHHDLTQLERTLKYIAEVMGGYVKTPLISASLAEYTVNFVKFQDEFVHDVVLLAKLWYTKQVKSSEVGETHGRSYTMELVAIDAAEKEAQARGKAGRKRFGAFLRFLQVFQQPKERVRVTFPLNVNPTLQAVHKQYGKMVKNPGGVILDPTNPWNNLLVNFTPGQWENIRRIAAYCFETVRNSPSEHVIRGRFE